jgi:hypothetical protein
MWRDPLDELIESLEAALPADTAPNTYEILPDLADLQMVLTPALFGTEEDIRRIKQTPLYHRVMAQLEQQAARRKKE